MINVDSGRKRRPGSYKNVRAKFVKRFQDSAKIPQEDPDIEEGEAAAVNVTFMSSVGRVIVVLTEGSVLLSSTIMYMYNTLMHCKILYSNVLYKNVLYSTVHYYTVQL